MKPDLKTPPGVLGEIVQRTLVDVAARAAQTPMAHLQAQIGGETRPFAAGLKTDGLSLIAEFKPRSPSRGPIRPGATPEELAEAYAPHAAAVSVLIDEPYFGGSFEALRRMRGAVPCPVMAKGFFVTPYQVVEARAAGADAILLMATLLPLEALRSLHALATSLDLGVLVETHDRVEMAEAVAAGAPVIGVNSRDLTTLKLDLDGACALLDAAPSDRIVVAESGLLTAADVDRVRDRADAVLIGSALMAAPDPAKQIAALGLAR